VKEDAGNAAGDINEILFFCRGITSGTSPGYITGALQALTQAVLDVYSRGKQTPSLDDAIGCLREALKTSLPGILRVSFGLSNLLTVRFLVRRADNDTDYDEAKALLDRITTSRSSEGPMCSWRFQAAALTTALAHARSIANSNPEVSARVASSCRLFLEHCTLFGDPLHPAITALLATHVERGANHNGPAQGAQAAQSVARLPISPQFPVGIFGDGIDGSDIVQVSSPISLEEKINHLRDHYPTVRPGTDDQRNTLKDLVRCYNAKISQTRDTTSINEAIKYNKRLLATTHPTDKSKFFHFSSFATYLYSAFNLTGRVKYLDDSIALLREVLHLDGPQQTRFVTTQRLIEYLYVRWQLGGRQHESADLDEVMELFASGAEDTHAMVPNRFDLACQWTDTARTCRHHSLPTAYKNVMSLMQSSLVFAPTLSIQHNRLVEKRDRYEKTPLNFASYHISAGQLELAIEVLEHGRALIWSEMRGLRTSTDQLRVADPILADKFTVISQELERVTTSALSDRRGPEDDEWTGKYSGLMTRQHGLLTERNALISQIRGLPGLENFFMPLPFDTLRSAASHGPIIVINHCELGSDIIIVLQNSPPSRISMPSNFFERANELKIRLLKIRKDYGLDSKVHEDALSVAQKEHALSDVLKELYELVGRSVVKRLNELGIAEKSRVWWCPTSAFWGLPLHAMGPVPSDGRVNCYFSDLYISSYTPTLSALITSRRPGTQTSARPTLLDAQPRQSPPGAWQDTLALRGLDLQTTTLTSGNMSRTAVLDGLRRHRFAHLPYDVTRETAGVGNPFEAAMMFHNEERLSLLDAVRSPLPAGEFTLLTGSHTAEATDGSLPDEVLHFSMGVQHAGFRSVIGTMWEVDDEDGRNLAKNVYRSMFSKKEGVEPYYERSARALQYAVQQMRTSLPLVRWVNFVHYGA
jgi:hypothetical protein